MHFIYSYKYNTNSAEDSSDYTEYCSQHNVYVFALAMARTPIAWVKVHHANHYTTKAHSLMSI